MKKIKSMKKPLNYYNPTYSSKMNGSMKKQQPMPPRQQLVY